MKILFLSISTAVKNLENRGIYPDLINYFSNNGHEMYIVCPSERRLKQRTSLKKEGHVHTLSVQTLNITKSNFIEKGIATILIEHQFSKAIHQHFNSEKFDLILYATPPISFNSLIKKLKGRYNCLTYLMLKDIFPQNAVDLGILKKSNLLYRFFRKKEDLLYKISDHIGCMSEANVAYLLNHNAIQPDKVEICPNAIKIIERKTDFSKEEYFKKYGIPVNVPIFLYGGNLGIAQGIEFLVKALDANKDRTDCFILIAGSGNRYDLIQHWIAVNKPKNIKLIGHLNRNDYDILESFCDVGMVFLDKNFTIPNFPSRILSYMECKLPLLISTDVASDLGSIASTNNFGLWSESGHLEDFNRNLNFYIENSQARIQMGGNGFEFLKKNYDVAISYTTIMNHFK